MWGVYLVLGGVSGPRGVSGPGVSGPRGGVSASVHAGIPPPPGTRHPSPVDRQTPVKT